MKPEPSTDTQNPTDTDRAILQLRAREMGHVNLPSTHRRSSVPLAQLIETYAWSTGEVNRALAWHAECVRVHFSTHVSNAARTLAFAMLDAQDAHDRLVAELTR